MAAPSSILAWRLPWTEESGGLPSMGSQESDTAQQLNNNSNTAVPERALPSVFGWWTRLPEFDLLLKLEPQSVMGQRWELKSKEWNVWK